MEVINASLELTTIGTHKGPGGRFGFWYNHALEQQCHVVGPGTGDAGQSWRIPGSSDTTIPAG